MKKNPLSNRSGVYALYCPTTLRSYVGYSTNVGRRVKTHLAALRRGKHANSALQSDFNKLGESVFLPRLVIESPDSEWGYQLEANLIKLGGDATYNVVESKTISDELRKHEEKFWKRCKPEGDCLIWTGKKSPQGYGVFTFYKDGKRFYVQAHRAAYFLEFEDPFSSRISHMCGNPLCIEPSHLILGVVNGASPSDIPQVVKLYQQGVLPKAIAKKLNLSNSTVLEVVRRYCGLRVSEALTPGCLSSEDVLRFRRKCKSSGDCLHFSAALNSGGFPTFSWEFGGRKRNTYAHRVAYFIAHGQCPDEVIHTCGNPHCVNVDHLRAKS